MDYPSHVTSRGKAYEMNEGKADACSLTCIVIHRWKNGGKEIRELINQTDVLERLL